MKKFISKYALGMLIFFIIWFVFTFSLLMAADINTAGSQEKQIVGRLEYVKICPENLAFKAKLDTGAANSSLDASNIIEFERDGKKWIRFNVVNYRNTKTTIEKRLIRYTKIKRHKQVAAVRPVIRLGICLGKYFKEVEFNLTDRTGFNFKMLIGCSFLEGLCVVDPAKKFTSDPVCESFCGQ